MSATAESLSPEELRRLEKRQMEVAQKMLEYQRQNKIDHFYPDFGPLRRELYPKHLAFFEAGAKFRQRAAISGNRVGKTEGLGGYELTCHMTGIYPHWWKGKRFTKPVRAWACGETGKTVREILQKKLLGAVKDFGTGLIPAEKLLRTTPIHGIPDAVDTVEVRHTMGISRLVLKSYEQGRKAFEGDEQEVILLDEKFPLEIYTECMTRTMTTGGIIMCTFTPTDGLSPGVLQFMPGGKMPNDGIRYVITIGWDDVPHLTEEAKAELRATYPEHELKARTQGIPMLGSGAVFSSVNEDNVRWKPTPIPDHWVRICGIDFGWDHPTAAAWLAWDRDTDVLYVYDVYRVSKATPVTHAAAIKSRGDWIPVAWPADGLQTEKGTGIQLAQQYREQGLNMIGEPARFEETQVVDGETAQSRVSVEAGVIMLIDRMTTGRLKVAEHLQEFWEEFRMYHRKDGRIVKEGDDVIAGVRYGAVMLRYAACKPRKVEVDTWRSPDSWRT